MSKRMRKDTLTGGTGDVSPQFLTGLGTQSAADLTTSFAFAIPRQIISTNNNSFAQVMEVLKVFWWTSGNNNVDSNAQATLSTVNFGQTPTDWGEPRTFAMYHQSWQVEGI